MSAYAVDIVSDFVIDNWVCKLDCHLEMEDCMGMIDDQTTGPWIKKKPAERKYFSYTKSKSSYPISI